MPSIKQLFLALGLTIVSFGSLHLVISYTLMIVRDFNEGNLFRILNIQKIFPGIDLGWKNFVISNIVAISLYLVWVGVIWYHSRKKSTHKES